MSNKLWREWKESNPQSQVWKLLPLPSGHSRIGAPSEIRTQTSAGFEPAASAVGLRARNRREMVPEERFELITVLFLRQTPPADWATRAKRSQRWPKGASAQAESIGFRDQLILKMIRGKNDRAGRVASLRLASRAVER